MLSCCRLNVNFRKLLKLLVVLGCLGGFSFQTYEFMGVYWTYPTVVDVKITNPSTVQLPAFTACNYNGILASKFCEKFTSLCHPERNFDAFCFPDPICRKNREHPLKKMPTINRGMLPKLSWKEYRDLGPNPKDLIHAYFAFDSLERIIDTKSRRWIGAVDTTPLPNHCYVLNSLWENVKAEPVKLPRKTVPAFVLKINQTEKFYMALPENFQLAVHDPRSLVNPFVDGFSLKAGGTYYIYVKQVVKHLLKAPYSTNCTDYREMWTARGGRGPLTEKQCVEECVQNATTEKTGCTNGEFPVYKDSDIFCVVDPRDIDKQTFKRCVTHCSPECHSFDYYVQIEEQGTADYNVKDIIIAEVRVSFNKMEVITYKYVPKYESVELFSYIGGYIGIWLGVSLLTVYDFVEVAWFFIRRKWKQSHGAPERKSRRTVLRLSQRNENRKTPNVRPFNTPVEVY